MAAFRTPAPRVAGQGRQVCTAGACPLDDSGVIALDDSGVIAGAGAVRLPARQATAGRTQALAVAGTELEDVLKTPSTPLPATAPGV